MVNIREAFIAPQLVCAHTPVKVASVPSYFLLDPLDLEDFVSLNPARCYHLDDVTDFLTDHGA